MENSRTNETSEETPNEKVIRAIWLQDGIELEEEESGSGNNCYYKQIEKICEAHTKRKLKLWGHIIRTDNEDPLGQVTLRPGTATSIHPGRRRVGKPRQDWAEEKLKLRGKKHIVVK